MATKPTAFSQALADEICRRMICGESLRAICEEEGMPATGTVYYWRNQNSVFAAQYEAARTARAEAIFDEVLDIVDDGRNDWMEKEGRNGSYIALNSEAVIRSKLRADTRLRMVEKMAPSRFGEKAQLDLTNSDGKLSPVNMTEEAKAARIAAIYQAAAARKKAGEKAGQPVDDGSDLV